MAKTFLTAEWRKLVMANYAVDPALLAPYVPHNTELDLWNNTCYVSLVGFMFLDTRLKGIRIPFHTNFEEVNLRFYVRHLSHGEWKRGVVFIKEIVPKPALTWVANTFYKEPYMTLPMDHAWTVGTDTALCRYRWKQQQQWHSIEVVTGKDTEEIIAGSEEEFITEHYWGYTKTGEYKTSEYAVEHPRWRVYPVKDYTIAVDFEQVYGQAFSSLTSQKPASVFLAEGSAIVVKEGNTI